MPVSIVKWFRESYPEFHGSACNGYRLLFRLQSYIAPGEVSHIGGRKRRHDKPRGQQAVTNKSERINFPRARLWLMSLAFAFNQIQLFASTSCLICSFLTPPRLQICGQAFYPPANFPNILPMKQNEKATRYLPWIWHVFIITRVLNYR